MFWVPLGPHYEKATGLATRRSRCKIMVVGLGYLLWSGCWALDGAMRTCIGKSNSLIVKLSWEPMWFLGLVFGYSFETIDACLPMNCDGAVLNYPQEARI